MSEQVSALFLALLKSGIWNTPADERLFENIGSSVWEDIIALGSAQKVNALLYDGVMLLPEPVRPERKVFYKLYLQTETIERLNDRANCELKNLSDEYEKLGFPFILLKGQGNAMLYPNPKHRTSGDIDVFLYRKEDYKKANDWAKNQGFKMDSENIHHQSFEYNGTHIENHKDVSYFGIKKYDDLLEREVRIIIQNESFIELEIENFTIKTLPHEFNAFFIFQHLFHHFIHLGVGVRQLCDWMLFWHKYAPEINKDSFIRLTNSFGLLNAMQIFGSVLVKYLGANPEIFPFETDVNGKYVDLVMQDMLSGGSFGSAIFENKSFSGKWSRKWYSFNISNKRLKKIYGIAPKHTRMLPMIKLVTNVKLLLKK